MFLFFIAFTIFLYYVFLKVNRGSLEYKSKTKHKQSKIKQSMIILQVTYTSTTHFTWTAYGSETKSWHRDFPERLSLNFIINAFLHKIQIWSWKDISFKHDMKEQILNTTISFSSQIKQKFIHIIRNIALFFFSKSLASDWLLSQKLCWKRHSTYTQRTEFPEPPSLAHEDMSKCKKDGTTQWMHCWESKWFHMIQSKERMCKATNDSLMDRDGWPKRNLT